MKFKASQSTLNMLYGATEVVLSVLFGEDAGFNNNTRDDADAV